MIKIPATANDFTPDWLNRALAPHLDGTHVTDCAAHLSDIPGQTAEIVMLDVSYATHTELPSRLVAKITSLNQDILDNLIAHYDQYYREVSFYREIKDVGISVPRCLYLDHDPETQAFVLLMQDLAPAESPSWAISTEQVCVALQALPAFHARWWNKPELRTRDWMVQFDNREFFAASTSAAASARNTLQQHYGPDASVSIELMAAVSERLEVLLAYNASRPFTFVHGDYHGKQMFFPTAEGGSFAVIDWQFPFVAQGPWDFARLAAMCLETPVRRYHEKALLADYLAGLRQHGVADYHSTDLEMDYRMGLTISQMIMSIAHGDTDVSLLEQECGSLGVDWRDAMLLRTQRAIEEWDVLAFIKSL